MRVVALSVLAFLVSARTGDVKCATLPPNWKDQDGDDCEKYFRSGWCGATWQKHYKDPSGKTADEACCSCGGGNRVCVYKKKMNCKQGCPSGWRHVGTSNHGCCASFANCGGNMKHCEWTVDCPNMCRTEKKMDCKENCPWGYRHIRTENHGCCAHAGSCGGNRKVCERIGPCRRRRLEGDLDASEFEELLRLMNEPEEAAHEIEDDQDIFRRRLA